jgi:hypothetical protein
VEVLPFELQVGPGRFTGAVAVMMAVDVFAAWIRPPRGPAQSVAVLREG